MSLLILWGRVSSWTLTPANSKQASNVEFYSNSLQHFLVDNLPIRRKTLALLLSFEGSSEAYAIWVEI